MCNEGMINRALENKTYIVCYKNLKSTSLKSMVPKMGPPAKSKGAQHLKITQCTLLHTPGKVFANLEEGPPFPTYNCSAINSYKKTNKGVTSAVISLNLGCLVLFYTP